MSARNDKDISLTILWVIVVVCLLICVFSLFSCSPRIVEVEKPVIIEQTHTQTHTDIVRDTLVWRDSVYHYVKGDTVIIERWHNTQQINKWVVTDTIRDTIPRVVTVTETRVQKVNVIHWWQRVLMWSGVVALLGLGLFAYKKVF